MAFGARGCAAIAAALVALSLGLGATSAFTQGTGDSSKPLLTFAPAESFPSGGAGRGATNTAKGKIDLNDPRVLRAISEAMDNPISEPIAVWNQVDAIEAHFPSTPLYAVRDLRAYRYHYRDTVATRLSGRAGQDPAPIAMARPAAGAELLGQLVHPLPRGNAGLCRLACAIPAARRRVVGLAIDNAANVAQFLQQQPVNYPILIGEGAAHNLARQLGNPSGALPYTIVIDRDGKIVLRHLGRLPRATLEQVLRKTRPA